MAVCVVSRRCRLRAPGRVGVGRVGALVCAVLLVAGCDPWDPGAPPGVDTLLGALAATGASAAEPAGGPPNDETVLAAAGTIRGDLAPKSVVASGTGLYFAQNMMYLHTISVFDADRRLVKTISDAVDLGGFGYDVAAGPHRGAPVEAAFTADGAYAFVSNYRMYGPGYDPAAGGDTCAKDQGQNSFVYRIDAAALEIDHVYEVGMVPKFLAVTPDDRFLLVSNWCSFDVTVVELATHAVVAVIDVGRYPRGIAVTGDSRTAYVAVMGSTDIAVIDLPAATGTATTDTTTGSTAGGATTDGGATDGGPVSYLSGVGVSPRHLLLSPDDSLLYATLNGENAVVAVDTTTGQVLRRVEPGRQPRSMAISDDGTALYVVNYRSDTLTKLRTEDFAVLQELPTAAQPIGITYDSLHDQVWVSAYSGAIHIFAETEPNPTTPDR